MENLRVSLKSKNELLKVKVSEQEETIQKMQEKTNLDEGVLENLRVIVEKDDAKIVNLQTEVRQLRLILRRRMTRSLKLRKRQKRSVRCGNQPHRTS